MKLNLDDQNERANEFVPFGIGFDVKLKEEILMNKLFPSTNEGTLTISVSFRCRSNSDLIQATVSLRVVGSGMATDATRRGALSFMSGHA